MDKKSVIITGVAGGIGSATARRLQDEGYRVFGLDIRQPEGTNCTGSQSEQSAGIQTDMSEQSSASFVFIQTDLTDMDSVQRAFSQINAQTDAVDCIINMAGIYDLNSLIEIDEQDFMRIFNINLFSIYRVNKTFLPLLSEGGRVIIISSELAPLDPLPFTGLYGVTKAAVEKYAYSLRMELQLLGHPVTVIRPGAIDTGFLGVSTARLDRFCNTTELYKCNAEKFRNIVDRVESRKVSPDRIAGLVVRAIRAKRPRYVYKINRNPLLLLLNALPDRAQNRIIARIIRAD